MGVHGRSLSAVYGIATLVAVAGAFLTWRFMVSRLWSGLAGSRPLFVGSVISTVILVIAGIAFDADRFPGWVLDDPGRFAPLAWIAAVAVIVKYWIAAFAWRSVPARYDSIYPREVPFATAAIREQRMSNRADIDAESIEYREWLNTLPGSRLIVTNRSGHPPDSYCVTLLR